METNLLIRFRTNEKSFSKNLGPNKYNRICEIKCKRFRLEFDTKAVIDIHDCKLFVEGYQHELKRRQLREKKNERMELLLFNENSTCNCCYDYTNVRKLFCNHYMCKNCLFRLFNTAIKDVSLIPIKCCKIEIPPKLGRFLLSKRKFEIFNSKYIEITCKNKMYCPNPLCSKFINLNLIDTSFSSFHRCFNCRTSICVDCKSHWHHGLTCKEHQTKEKMEEKMLNSLIKEEKWSKCANCGHVIELGLGCFHMTCLCGYSFCYLCNKKWKTCDCRHWDEDRLITVARNREIDVEELRENHVCDHYDWRRSNCYWERCENCNFTMKHYTYVCQHCRLRVCYTCRHHRMLV